jgi:NAD-dependent DNA ligase
MEKTMVDYIRGKHLDAQNKNKAVDTLLGAFQGVICDGKISLEEVEFLIQMINDHKDDVKDIPHLGTILRILRECLNDRVVSAEEQEKLLGIFKSYTGTTYFEDGKTEYKSISFYKIFEKDPDINFKGRIFSLTGNFEYGTKSLVESEIVKRGGRVHDGMNRDINYLVVGNFGSKDWKHNSWGTKIEKAVKIIKSREYDLSIVSETDLLISFND